MVGRHIIPVIIGVAFLGKAGLELATQRAYGKTSAVRRDKAPLSYWIIVSTSIVVGAFVLYIGITRWTHV
jgi:hypothetical protein